VIRDQLEGAISLEISEELLMLKDPNNRLNSLKLLMSEQERKFVQSNRNIKKQRIMMRDFKSPSNKKEVFQLGLGFANTDPTKLLK
jgi:hypothetical protein